MFDISRMALARAVTMILLLGLAACSSRQYTSGAITVTDPWARATPAGAATGAAYMKISNAGRSPVRLVGGAAAVAQRVEVHTMSMDGGVMRMRPVVGGLEIPAGASIELRPGRDHLMLFGMRQSLKENEPVPLTLSFDGGQNLEIELAVKAMGGSGH